MRTAAWIVASLLAVALILLALSCGGDDGTGPESQNTAPTASFTASPSAGTTSTTFQVNASGSSDAQDAVSVLQVRWDWENNGTWDTPWSTTKTASHLYATPGTKTIKLEIKDTGGLTDTTTRTVTVTTDTPEGPHSYVVDPNHPADFSQIQAAIDVASPGDTVNLVDAIFTGDGNRDISYRGKGVTVRSLSRNPTACVIDCMGSPDSTHRGFDFISEEDASAVLEGVTIRNGYVSGFYGRQGMGAAIRCERSSPTIRNCVFEGNTAAGDGGHGGGILCYNGSSPMIVGCVFRGNRADMGGGGAYCWHASNPTFVDCSFLDNLGSGIDCDVNGNATFTRCLFLRNLPAVSLYASEPLFEYCVFLDNEDGVVCSEDGNARFESCTFAGNTGKSVYCLNASPTFASTIIAFTKARNEYAPGPAFRCETRWGGVSDPLLTCCDLYGNTGGDWTGCVADQEGVSGNVSVDPLFCDLMNGNVSLRADSPCLSSSVCGTVGAEGQGCSKR
ncbi:MAG: hypothetical protein FJY88_12990 [Candidatus Eisenbacteria bacterium]|nr:hypothetical protein [Candidatus Eisenbacteria bacterium]